MTRSRASKAPPALPREISDARTDRIQLLWDLGATDEEIAVSAGMTLNGVQRRRSRMGLLRDPALAEIIREHHSRGTV
ncbi:hypothetical protein [Rathayibacter sp. AY1E1]|uniref:hypothetical protein n=1 Tax=Rathayibacter sp. AY1E1 TaxID=2080549 RepID=UPI000CE747E9|nr:hypothetical protein [Rathayibacter sp. AY1E1]PPH51222.1 hypothetical protein C5C67_11950 [Rathayibacter sp. AY1E1]